ncbi:hypothetical protein GOP47_0026107 [Adiantum capillus-veneris]|uniref:Uncharacterized protein n=1 Tax=Adiantum capillus-veneris TaxID=13818 RepID=A0A9D4U1Q2_ADICA|nr:hypothetical protein GOP47_0026107 [Adiantum capillus-veneris]
MPPFARHAGEHPKPSHKGSGTAQLYACRNTSGTEPNPHRSFYNSANRSRALHISNEPARHLEAIENGPRALHPRNEPAPHLEAIPLPKTRWEDIRPLELQKYGLLVA